MEATEQKNIAESIIETMKDLGNIQIISEPEAGEELVQPTLVAVPQGLTVKDVTDHHIAAMIRLKPLRRTGTAKLADLDSFIAWTNRFKGAASMIFAQIAPAPKLTAVIDYHGEGGPTMTPNTRDLLANACAHRAVYDFPISPEWKLWHSIHDRPLTKDEFGEFTVRVVEVCVDCGWNHMTSSFLLGDGVKRRPPRRQKTVEDIYG